jgi:hypothetical protein
LRAAAAPILFKTPSLFYFFIFFLRALLLLANENNEKNTKKACQKQSKRVKGPLCLREIERHV